MQTPASSTLFAWRRIAVALLPALLAACGGGGSSTPESTTAQATGATPPAVAATCNLPDFQAAAMARINQWRAAGATCGSHGTFAPAAALTWNSRLTQAATGHSSDMQALNYFSHTSADGRTLANRIDATGYAWSSIGENIAAGYATVNIVVDAWIASEGHCANLLNPNFTEVGLACVSGTSANAFSNYWTMDLALPL